MKRTTPLLACGLVLGALAFSPPAMAWDQDVVLGAAPNYATPIYLENFDALAELALPPGWTVTNRTDANTAGDNIDDLSSDTYKGWVVITADRITTLKSRVMAIGAITLNGDPVDTLASGNLIYAESDVRDGNQVQYLETSDYDLTGKDKIYAVFNSLYEQNQDNVNGLEYSTDSGATWNPAIYYIYGRQDTGQGGPDVILDSIGNIDVNATLNTARGDQAEGKAYGAFLSAPINTDTALFIQGRINDDRTDGKRIEVVRLPKADNQAKVRFRFFQAGTGSWYWGIDNFGIYSLPEARINYQPQNVKANFGASATFKVTATGTGPLTYQWFHGGNPVAGGTSATLTLNNLLVADAGEYYVTVSNSIRTETSDTVNLYVIATPVIDTQPVRQVVSAQAPFSLSVAASGPGPITYQWQKGQVDILNATSATYSVASSAGTDSGLYRVIVSNANGSATSDEVEVKVVTGPITQDLVVHLAFDTDASDSSGHNNNGTAESQVLLDGVTDPGPPTFEGGGAQLIGTGAMHLKDGQDVLLGSPADLLFGADTDFTFSFWVKANTGAWTGDPSFIGNKNWTSGGNQGYVVAAGTANWKYNWKADVGPRRDSNDRFATPSLQDNKWHNIIISHDRLANASFYVDGTLIGTMPIAGDGSIDSLDTFIGQDGTGHYGFFNDRGAHFLDLFMDDFGIWRRVVTAQEAASIYAHGVKGEDLTKASGAPVVVPPSIGTPPGNQFIAPGGTATFTVVANGTAPLTYQWQKGGVNVTGANVSGATTATLTITSVSAADAGDYTVIVSNSAGNTTGGPAKLTLNVPPTLVVAGQWDFEQGDLRATIGNDLTYGDDAGTTAVKDHTSFGTTASFGIANIGGKVAKVMKYTRDAAPPGGDPHGFILRHGIPANGGGAKVNQYTLVFDVLVPNLAEGDGYNSLFKVRGVTSASTDFASDGDFFIRNTSVAGAGTGGIGQGNYAPAAGSPVYIKQGQWHRIVVAMDQTANAYSKYIDGVKFNDIARTDGTDGRYALNDTLRLFSDGEHDNEVNTIYVNSIQIWNARLTDAQVAALGAPSATGISAPHIGNIYGLWNFEGDLRATIGNDLAYGDDTGTTAVKDHTAFGTTTSFGVPDIGGIPAAVLKYSRDSAPPGGDPHGYILRHGIPSNGNGAKVNQYTLIYDVMFPNLAEGDGYMALFKARGVTSASTDFASDADFFVKNTSVAGAGTGGIGQGSYGPAAGSPAYIKQGQWHRIVVAMDQSANVYSKYIDGVKFADQTRTDGPDGRFALNDVLRIFSDGEHDNEVNTFYAKSVQIRTGRMTDADVAALGGPSAFGIPNPLQPAPLAKVTASLNGATLTLTWAGAAGTRLQSSTSISPGSWADVAGTDGQNSATVTVQPNANATTFYRLVK